MEAEGVIRHIEGNRFSLAELDGSKSDGIDRVAEAFGRAAARSRRAQRQSDGRC